MAVYGFLGMLWGAIYRDERKRSIVLYGALAGLLVYFISYDFLWKHANPLVPLYAPNRTLQLGHILWGLVLARSPKISRRLAAPPAPPRAEELGVEEPAQAVSSGELIR